MKKSKMNDTKGKIQSQILKIEGRQKYEEEKMGGPKMVRDFSVSHL